MRISDWSSDVCSSDLEVYENSQTAFVASFVGENNPFTGKVVAADGGHAVVETAFGPLRGRNLGGLGAGSHAMLFVRPESLGLVNGHAPAENVIESQVVHSEFEGSFFRSEERRVGKGGVSTGRIRGWQDN